MHKPIHDRARGTVAALVLILAALAVASLTAPPLGGLAAVALVLGVLGVAVVARSEGVAR
ncbi:MAG TPA: hypothetical protein VKY79_03060 [Actinomycetaceae bacterium]|nr:hypothetical protein [Actinomycetaceae bacterium]